MNVRETALVRDMLVRTRLAVEVAMLDTLQTRQSEQTRRARAEADALLVEVVMLRERNAWLEDELLRFAILRHRRIGSFA